MSAIIGTAVKGNEAGSAVSSPANITDVVNSFQSDGTTNVITWQNIAIWLGARAAADLANVKLATLESGVVPGSQLPFTGFEFRGDYNPATNTPALANTDTGKTNWVYRITGSANPTARDFGAGSINCSDDEYLAYSGDSGAGAWINIGQGATKQIGEGGTGSTTAAGARTNLSVYSKDEASDRANARQSANGVYFNGTSAGISIGDQALLEPGEDADFTIGFSFFFENNPSGNAYLFSKEVSGNPGWFSKIDSSGRLSSQIKDAGGTQASTADGASLAGKWHRGVIVFDRDGNMTRYVDGVAYGTADDISSINGDLANSGDAYIGRIASGGYFEGSITNVVFYNRALSSLEVSRDAVDQTIQADDQWGGADQITNGTFAADSNWIKGAGWTISGGTASCASGSTDLEQSQFASAKAGDRYRVTFDVANYTSGTVQVRLGSTGGTARSANGTYIEEFTYVSGTNLGFRSASFVGDVDNVKLEKLGAVVALLPENIESDGSVRDASSNGLHAAGTSTTPLRKTQVVDIDAESPAADSMLLNVKVAGSSKAGIDAEGTIRQENLATDAPVAKYAADAITTAGTVSHQIPVDIGGTVYYFVAHTHGS